MVFCRVMINRVIRKIVFYFIPVDIKLILLILIMNPINLHVCGFGFALDDGVGDDANRKFVVKLNWNWSLFVANFI